MARCRRSDPIVLIYPGSRCVFVMGCCLLVSPFPPCWTSHTPCLCGNFARTRTPHRFGTPTASSFRTSRRPPRRRPLQPPATMMTRLPWGWGSIRWTAAGRSWKSNFPAMVAMRPARSIRPTPARPKRRWSRWWRTRPKNAQTCAFICGRSGRSGWMQWLLAAIYCTVLICCWFFFPSILSSFANTGLF